MASRKKPFPLEQLSEESQRLFDVLNSEPDVPAVLVAASFLDQSLASMLSRFFIESRTSDKLLDPNGGALGTFSSRIDIAYVLGFINKYMYQDLLTIAEIRNLVAHSHLTVDLNSDDIARKVSELKYLEALENPDPKNQNPQPGLLRSYINSNRDRFTLTVVMISQQLLVRGLGVKRREQNMGKRKKT